MIVSPVREMGNIHLSYIVSIRWSHLGEEMRVIPYQALGADSLGICVRDKGRLHPNWRLVHKEGLPRNDGSSKVTIPFNGVACGCYPNFKNFFIA